MQFFGLPRAVVWIVVAAIAIRLLLFAVLLGTHGSSVFVLSDTNGYMRIAHNLVEGNGFAQETEPPYRPDSMRTVLFPSVLAGSWLAFGSYTPVVVLQIFLAGLIVLLTYLITKRVSHNERIALVAAALMAFEPYSIYISLSILTEVIFTTFLVAGAYMAVRFIDDKVWWNLAAASALFGFAALTRPIGQFLPFVLIVLVLMRIPLRVSGRYLAFAILPFLIVIGPWLARNYSHFQVAALSSSGLQNAYSDLGGAIISYRDHIPTYIAKQQLEEDFAKRHQMDLVTFQQDLSKSPSMFGEAIQIMLTNPIHTIKAFTSITITYFTNDAWAYYPQRWGFLPRYDYTFSPSYVLMTDGPVVAFKRIVSETGWTLPIPIAGRLFWVVVTACLALGAVSLYVRGGTARIHGVFLVLIILYLLALSATVGFGINGRFRYPASALIFSVAVVGAYAFLPGLMRRLRVRH